MEAVQLFLNINKPGLNNEWNTKITELLKALPSAEQIRVIEKNESSFAQISISYKVDELSFTQIENIVMDCGATIADINIHFPSGITGIAGPYGARAISITIEEKMKTIEGVLSGSISSNGKLKVVLDTTVKDKQEVIEKLLKTYSSIKEGDSSL